MSQKFLVVYSGVLTVVFALTVLSGFAPRSKSGSGARKNRRMRWRSTVASSAVEFAAPTPVSASLAASQRATAPGASPRA